MAYLKAKEARSLGGADRRQRLQELRQDLMHERGVAAMGGSPPSPGKIRQLRRQIARLLTIEREDQLVREGKLWRRPRPTGAGSARAGPAATPGSKTEPKTKKQGE